jgi:amino acid adenylation domain-containing protein
LKQALQDVLGRHDAFRVQFGLEDPVQRLAAAAALPVAEVELRAQPDADAALDTFCSEASLRDFPVDRAPLAAVSLLDLADGRTVVHVVASHLVFDGWASSVFNAELAEAYRARATGLVPAFKPAESPLAFGTEEQARFAGPDGQEALAFWTEHLRGAPAPLSLGDRTPTGARTFAADTVRVRLDGDALARLRAQAKLQSATLFQVLLSAVTVVLHRRSGQDDFVVSIPYASQSLQRRGPLLADGVLDLPLRLRCAPSDDATWVLQRVRNHLMDALEHPVMTQGTVARALGIRSVGSRPPLTGIYFNLNPRVDLSGWAPLQATMFEGRKRGVLSELFFNFYETDDALTLDLHHSSEFFSPQRAQDLVDDLMDQCRAWATALVGPAGSAPVRAAVPVDPRLLAWNRTPMPLEGRARLERWVTAQAERTPDSIAVTAPGGSLTYRALDERANRFANLLRARGAGAGALVGVCLGRGLDLLPALLGVLKTGAAYVPLDPGFPKERLQYMAEDAALHTVITEQRHADLAGLPRARQLRVDDDAALLDAAPATPVPAPADAPENAPAYVIYTSGSTGKPKGVVLPQQAVCNFIASMQREPGLKAGDRLLAVTTLSFDIAVLELFVPLTTGATVVLAQREDAMDADALSQLITAERINVMQATPTTWHLLLDAGWRAPAAFRALCGGEPLPPALAARLLAAPVELWNMYGPTETTVWSTLARITDAAQRITIGRPIANTQVWVVDGRMNPCPVGVEGEICIGGTGVANGYFKRPELTADRFVDDPFSTTPGARLYRTGDLGRWGEDGQLHHLGRLDFQVKVRGYRIELGEIEARLEALPGVARTVVVAREDSPGDVRLVGYLVAAPGTTPDPAALRQALKAGLPDYMVPQHLVVLASMPLLPNGKIDRKGLPAPAGAAPVPVTVPVPAPRPATGDLVAQMASAMAEVLGVPSVGPDDHFFELGGHSLQAAKLASRIGALVGTRPSLRTLFEHATPRGLAAALGTPAAGAQPVQALRVKARPEQRMAPLSLMQHRLWFLENMNPDTPFNQLPSGHRLSGPLDVAAFQRAFQQVVDRQSALRTVIERTPEGPRQRVLDTVTPAWPPVEDMRALPAAERDAAVRERIRGLTLVPMDLERGPLFHVHLFQTGDLEHVLFFMVHHLVWDGSSFDVLYRDLAALYPAAAEGHAPEIEPLAVSYGDFAESQREWMQGEELTRQVASWREMLTPLPESLDLPTDRARPAEMTGDGRSCQALLPPDLVLSLQQLARRQGVTLSTVMLSAYALQLHRMSGQNDFAIATPVRGREQAELEPVAGFFVNALPLRMRPQGTLGFDRWLHQVQDTVGTAFASPDVPFEHLVQALGVARDTSRPMVAQVLYSYQDVRERPVQWGPIGHKRFDIDLRGSSHDLSLYCVELSAGLECALTFNTDVFDEGTVHHFLLRLEHLLRQIVAAPATALADFQLATPGEQAAIDAWNTTGAPFDLDTTVHARIAAAATAHTDSVAITQPGFGSISHGELDVRANRLAHLLRSRGIGRGDLVGLCIDRGVDMVVAQLAILKAGAAYVPLDPAYPADRLAYMAEDAKLALLVTESALVQSIDWPRARSVLVDIDAMTITGQPETALAPDPERDARPTDAAYVIYTSGSTGKPKGVMVPHRAVVNFLDSMAREPGLAARDRLVAVTTLSFDIAVLELLLPLAVGAEVVLASRDTALDSQALRALVESTGATVMQATPSTWRMLIESGWQGSPTFKALIGGEGLPTDLADQLIARTGALWNMYGPTETTVWSTCCQVTSIERGISIGRPIANTQVHILDDRLQPVPLGIPGEVWIGGDGVTLGYLHRPELTAERFVDDPFRPGATMYRTGDRGRWRHDGQLEHLGRLDFQVKVRGYRIELGEIESNLAAHPQVARSLVIVREDQPGDVRLVAYVVARGEAPAADALREHLRAGLPEYMLPQHVVFLDAIPLLPNGKTNRHALPAPAAQVGGTADRSIVAPRNEAESVVVDIWKSLLGVPHVSITDNFFDLGGHSLLAMRAVIELEKRLGVRLNVRRLIFETLTQIASSATPAGPELATAGAPAPTPATPARAPEPKGLWGRLMGAFRSGS